MNKEINGVMMQYFEWYMNCNKNLWNTVRKKGDELSKLGITSLWLPPAYKGIGGEKEVGYGVYDLYDLGEFDQKAVFQRNMELRMNILMLLLNYNKMELMYMEI